MVSDPCEHEVNPKTLICHKCGLSALGILERGEQLTAAEGETDKLSQDAGVFWVGLDEY